MEDIIKLNLRDFCLFIDSPRNYTLSLQKVHKEIIILIHMNRAYEFSTNCLKLTRLLYMMNKLNLGFYSHINIDQRTLVLA